MKLNCDLGEGVGCEEAVMPFIDQASIACGAHAGDTELMRTTVALAKEFGVSIGAHPGYPDRENFGRSSLKYSLQEIEVMVAEQVETLAQFGDVDYVKPHGALYHDMMQQEEILQVIRGVIGGRPLMVQALLETASKDAGLINEVFADRRYADNGGLLLRAQSGAVLSEEQILEQVGLITKENVIQSNTGRRMQVMADSICVHGDNPAAVSAIEAVRRLLENG